MAGELVTNSGDFEWAGLLFNSGPGGGIHFDRLDGLAGLAPKRDNQRDRVADGFSIGESRRSGRTITALGASIEDDDTLDDLRAAMSVTGVHELVWRGIAGRGTGERLVYAEAMNLDVTVDAQGYRNQSYTADLEWACPDPRVFNNSVKTETIDSSTSTITNAGNTAGMWSVEVAGPCVNPRIRRIDDPQAFTFYYRGTVASGKTLVINSRTKTATIDGRSVLGSCTGYSPDDLHAWIPLDPGDNDFRFGSDSGTSSVTFAWRDAWC